MFIAPVSNYSYTRQNFRNNNYQTNINRSYPKDSVSFRGLTTEVIDKIPLPQQIENLGKLEQMFLEAAKLRPGETLPETLQKGFESALTEVLGEGGIKGLVKQDDPQQFIDVTDRSIKINNRFQSRVQFDRQKNNLSIMYVPPFDKENNNNNILFSIFGINFEKGKLANVARIPIDNFLGMGTIDAKHFVCFKPGSNGGYIVSKNYISTPHSTKPVFPQ